MIKKPLFLICILLVYLGGRGQVLMADSAKDLGRLVAGVSALRVEQKRLSSNLQTLTRQLAAVRDSIDSVKIRLDDGRKAIVRTGEDLDSRMRSIGSTNEKKISAVDASLSKSTLYWTLAFLGAILLLVLVYWLLSRRQRTDRSFLIDQLSQTRAGVEQSLVTEFAKQAELMKAQLDFFEGQKQLPRVGVNSEPDHALALKVADEINLIERNISHMDPKTRGLKQLNASIEKLKDNLQANNYEMPTLLGKPYDQGLKVIVINSIPDENLPKGQEMITKIIKPQVNYNDKMIQAAQIEVSVGI